MICKNCPEGRRFAAGSVNCLKFGMIIREDHECRFYEGGERHGGGAGDHGEDGENEAELSENRGGAA